MSAAEQVQVYCDTENQSLLINMPRYAQQLLLYWAKEKIKMEPDAKTPIAERVIDFFWTLPRNYKPMIRHSSNTCWIASSIWFASSQQLLLNMLSVYPLPLDPVLELLRDRMNVATSREDRGVAVEKNWVDILGCLVRHGRYQKGDAEDISRNWDDIMDKIPDDIRTQLYAHSNLNRSRAIFGKGGNKLSVDESVALFADLANQYNALRVEVDAEFKQHVKDSNGGDVADKLMQVNVLLGLPVIPDITVDLAKAVPKFWEKAYELWTGKYDANVSNYDRFCGLAHGYAKPTYERLCDLKRIQIQLFNLQSNYLNIGETAGAIDWGFNLPVQNFSTVQEFITDLEAPKANAVRVSEFESYDIRYETRNALGINEKVYLVIKLNFGRDPATGDMILPEDGSLTIDTDITVSGQQYTLTAVGTKSGLAGGGHWWCLMRYPSSTGKVVFIEYNDISNHHTPAHGMDYINQFSANEGFSSLLCYTRKSLY